jgi:hypothetical protein
VFLGHPLGNHDDEYKCQYRSNAGEGVYYTNATFDGERTIQCPSPTLNDMDRGRKEMMLNLTGHFRFSCVQYWSLAVRCEEERIIRIL